MNETLPSVDVKTETLQGKATIEIFEGNRLVKRISDNNYINMALRNFAAFLTANGYLNNVDFDLSAAIESYYTAPFGLCLINNDVPANPSKSEIPLGEVTGIARVEITNPGTKQGVYIALESVTTNRYYRKLVFDFPTSAANGTFNNIYTFQGSPDGSSMRLREFFQVNFPKIDAFFPGFYAMDDTYVYILMKSDRSGNTNTNQMARFTRANFAHGLLYGEITGKYDVITLNYQVASIVYLDGYYYFTSYNSGNLFRSTKNSPGALTIVKTFTTELWTTLNLSLGADPVSKKLYIYANNYNNAPASGNCYVIDRTNFSVLDKMHIGDYSSNMYQIRFAENGRYMSMNEFVYDTQLKKTVDSSTGTLITSDGLFGMPLAHYNGDLICKYGGTFSRFMLESPVTKTSTQTMKITYEFTIDKPIASLNPII